MTFKNSKECKVEFEAGNCIDFERVSHEIGDAKAGTTGFWGVEPT